MSQPDFACNPHELWVYIKQNTCHETAWIVKRRTHYDKLVERGIRCAVYDTLQARDLLLEADYIIANSYTFANIYKKKGALLVNLWHGSGIKAHDFYNTNLSPKQAQKIKDYFSLVDLMCVHSLDDRFKLSAMLNFDLRKIQVTGQPRLDLVNKNHTSNRIAQLIDNNILKYKCLIFFAPSFRANMSSHAGKLFSDNIFRVNDYNCNQLDEILEKYNAAIIYKLHPIEQTAFKGRSFKLSKHCYELTDEILFDADVRYDEILCEFNVMISDYSSIAFDYLLLDRPIIYLLPDYYEYKSSKGFVFNAVDMFMPGDKTYTFNELIIAIGEAIENPGKYSKEREFVLKYRFDYTDNCSSYRCYKQIIKHKPIEDKYVPYRSNIDTIMPTITDHLFSYIHDSSEDILLIDSTKPINQELAYKIEIADKVYYITSELPNNFRPLSAKNVYRIYDIDFYNSIKNNSKVNIAYITGGVDYEMFSTTTSSEKNETKRIGFAGTIDTRIYFSMVQCICEAFPEFEIVFAGTILGDYPAWLNGYNNLKYIECEYSVLPNIIESFDVAILPFFGGHNNKIPSELFQFLASGKIVVSSNLLDCPECSAIFKSDSVSDAVDNIKIALQKINDKNIIADARRIAKQYDWSIIAQRLLYNKYNYNKEDLS